MKQLLFFLSIACFTQAGLGQANSSWSILSLVTYEKQYNVTLGMEIDIPKINPMVEKMSGKEIEVSGYIIPLEGKIEQSHFVFSAFPMSSCFFCGKAGPETAMEVDMGNQEKVKYSDEKITLKGILRVRKSDGMTLMYKLEDAVLL